MEDVVIIKTAPRIGPFIAAGLGVVFAAFCVWLTVRIVNRRVRP